MYTVTIVNPDGLTSEWTVNAIAPGAMREPAEPYRDLSIIAYTLYGPAAGAPSHDNQKVILDGKTYQIDGTPSDWTRGPAPSGGGVVVELRRTTG